ncbi:chemotaxis protein CheB [Sediminitomix flava]|uniref:protein-glutamate methylesterase n=1 Tax=Sediminitomix flava TaxID=379075 RepID=A0A316A4L0_SEDFL|nr:chemotaxis protein CheB [Sediminitomix flava]PWJ44687.1 two-component system chemotaxis response regulator CheB [Sediminitomix flava]
MRYQLSDRYRAIVIGGSAGSFQPITKLLSKLPSEFPLPIFLCLHRLKHVRHGFTEALSIKSNKVIEEPNDKDPIRAGRVYLAPANYHLLTEPNRQLSLSTEEMVNNSRPSIDLTFESAAHTYGDRLIGILYSGANSDGAEGMKLIKALGGITIIQDPEECMINTMPLAAQNKTQIDYCLESDEIINFLLELHKYYHL